MLQLLLPVLTHYEYHGCHRPNWSVWRRPYGDVGTASGGFDGSFKLCADRCKGGGYAYFGLE